MHTIDRLCQFEVRSVLETRRRVSKQQDIDGIYFFSSSILFVVRVSIVWQTMANTAQLHEIESCSSMQQYQQQQQQHRKKRRCVICVNYNIYQLSIWPLWAHAVSIITIIKLENWHVVRGAFFSLTISHTIALSHTQFDDILCSISISIEWHCPTTHAIY